MNGIETFLLQLNLSWFLSKLLPYLLFPVMGIIVGVLVVKYFSIRSKFKRIILFILFPVSSFGAYFAYSPIYQGDFSNNSTELMMDDVYTDIGENKLTVISIPNCPYCFGAMKKMLILKDRNPSLQIEFIVCSSDSLALKWYKENSKDRISVVLANEPKVLAKLADFAFPAYVIKEGNDKLIKWRNNDFGVRALDQVESILKKNN